MKRVIIFILVVLLIVVIATGADKSEDSIKIGAVLPLSGIGSHYGEHQHNGITLALEEINSAGGVLGLPLEIVFEDDETNPTKTVSAVQKLITIDGVEVMIGGVWDFLANAAIPVANEHKKLIISPSTPIDTLDSSDNEYFYTTFPAIANSVDAFEQYLNRSNELGVVIMVIDNAWGLAHMNALKEAALSEGHIILKEVVLPQFDGNDIQRELTLIKDLNPDIILTALNVQDPRNLIQKNRSLGINAEIFGHLNLITNLETGSLSAEEIEGVSVYRLSPPKEEFTAKYHARFGREPLNDADTAYDAVYLIREAIEHAGVYESDQIVEGLRQINNYKGVSGVFDFSKRNYPSNKQSFIATFVDGGLVEW